MSNARPSILARLALDKTGAAAAFGTHTSPPSHASRWPSNFAPNSATSDPEILRCGNEPGRQSLLSRSTILQVLCFRVFRVFRGVNCRLMGHGLFGPTPTGSLSPFLRQTCLFLFFCESQQILHQHVPIFDFLRGAIFSFRFSIPKLPRPVCPARPVPAQSNQIKPDDTLFQKRVGDNVRKIKAPKREGVRPRNVPVRTDSTPSHSF